MSPEWKKDGGNNEVSTLIHVERLHGGVLTGKTPSSYCLQEEFSALYLFALF